MQQILATYDADQIFVLTDQHAKQHLVYLQIDGYPTLVMPSGEENKNIDMVCRIWEWLLSHHATRRALLINVGGGVITDMGGFAAGCYKRGIDFVNIPTTLLAMVDASAGGKTGFNFHDIKNSIGLFRTPKQTIIDTRLLHTLPAKELLSGYAEMIKHGLIDSPEHLNALLSFELSQSPDWEQLSLLIHRSILVKEQITRQDPDEIGVRKLLNLGHTVGHALEALSIIHHDEFGENYPIMPHGFAVAYGLIAELYISHRMLNMDKQLLISISHFVVENYGRINVSCRDYDQLLSLMKQDKKNEQTDTYNCTLVRAVGDAVVNCHVTDDMMREALDYLFSY